jgi:hypothetical protein
MKAATFIGPLVFVVFGVRHDFQNEDLVRCVDNARRKSILVSPNVEDDTTTHDARSAKSRFDIRP